MFVADSFGEAKLVGRQSRQRIFAFRARPADGVAALTSDDADLFVARPYGIDHYFFLMSSTPIEKPEIIFNFAGARSRGSNRPARSPLSRPCLITLRRGCGGVSGIPLGGPIEHLTLLGVQNGVNDFLRTQKGPSSKARPNSFALSLGAILRPLPWPSQRTCFPAAGNSPPPGALQLDSCR